MPANLTPEFEKAQRFYRQAATDEQKLDALREMLSVIPKHKGTDRMQGDIKRRISQLRKTLVKSSSAKGPDPFHIPRSGAGQVVLIGAPNVGKSMLVATTTNAQVKVADYPFTTAIPAPGMWAYEDVQIEVIDTPPITPQHIPAGLMGTIRFAELVAVMVDAATEPVAQAQAILGQLDERGLALRSVRRDELDPDQTGVQSGIIIASKMDLAAPDDIQALRELFAGKLEVWAVSAETGEGLGELLERLWQLLAVIRVYTKQPGKAPDRDKPFTLPAGATVDDLAGEIHRELTEKMKYARIWRDGRFAGQHVRRDESLRDKDVVEIHG